MARQIDLIGDVVPDDRVVQVDSGFYVREVGRKLPKGALVLDVGCGTGRSEKMFAALGRGATWIGVDIPSSPAVEKRTDHERRYVTFDGIQLPFGGDSIDCVYSNQVLEHVRHPSDLLEEVARVLKPGGAFIGGTSNLEPYHAYSYWNFTPFGFKTLVEAAGMRLVELRPGIDGPTLIERQVRGRPPELNKYFTEMSPLNQEIVANSSKRRSHVRGVNNRMLQFCGQFGFRATKDR